MAKTKTTADPTTAADEARTAAEQERAEATRTTREVGKNSNGDPTLYPSDVAAVTTAHGLTVPEAEEHILSGTSPDELKARRVLYRSSYDQIPATAENHPLVAADAAHTAAEEEARKAAEDRAAAQAEANAPTTDKTQPEAGPYGPYAEYRKVEVSDRELAENAGVSVEDAPKLRADASTEVG